MVNLEVKNQAQEDSLAVQSSTPPIRIKNSILAEQVKSKIKNLEAKWVKRKINNKNQQLIKNNLHKDLALVDQNHKYKDPPNSVMVYQHSKSSENDSNRIKSNWDRNTRSWSNRFLKTKNSLSSNIIQAVRNLSKLLKKRCRFSKMSISLAVMLKVMWSNLTRFYYKR